MLTVSRGFPITHQRFSKDYYKLCKLFRSLTVDSPKTDSKLRKLFRAFAKIYGDCRGISQYVSTVQKHILAHLNEAKKPRHKWHHRYIIDEIVVTDLSLALF